MQEGNRQPNDLIFALDIGTRSVIGVVGERQGDVFCARCIEVLEHPQRAVVDGQIENIDETAAVARQVKERLEQRLGVTLTHVHVAAAGRVIQTCRATAAVELGGAPADARHIYLLESTAIQNAYEQLAGELQLQDITPDFYCVGHSVVGYTLDGYSYSTLIGHRGRQAGVELIATFLPSEVVESLYATMQLVGLSIASLTLEPIAAISAVIPRELRLLDIALVDVGAGTSDIAVAGGGSIVAYGMATVAGDEITEHIMRELLVDFGTAERIKFELSAAVGGDDILIEYQNILGMPGGIMAHELLKRTAPAVGLLADTIAGQLLGISATPPAAVFMVGGGSRTPGLCAQLADRLSLDEDKVAIGGSNYMKRQIVADAPYINAEFATPMGIALTAAMGQGTETFTVALNGKQVPLQAGGGMTVLELLLRSGYEYSRIMGRSGRSVRYYLNGERRTVRGGLPKLAQITVNGALAGMTTRLAAGDEVAFEPAENGGDADCTISKVITPWQPFTVVLSGAVVPAGTIATVNGAPAAGDYTIRPDDRVELAQLFTVAELLAHRGVEIPADRLLLGGSPAQPTDRLSPGDAITALPQEAAPLTPTPVPYADLNAPGSIKVVVNGRALMLPPKPDGGVYQFFDMLVHTDIDPAEPQGEIVILKNGNSASYIEPLADGDSIEIYWREWQQPTT